MDPQILQSLAEKKVKNLKKTELLRLCRAIGLNTYGLKKNLIENLVQWAKQSDNNYQQLITEQVRSTPYNLPGQYIPPVAPKVNIPPPMLDQKDVFFEQSLFFNVVRTIEVKRFHWNNNNVYKCPFRLEKSDIVLLDSKDSETGLKLHKIFCCVGNMPTTPNTPVKLDFHDSSTMRLNNQTVAIVGSFKKPKSKKPGDLTPLINRFGQNELYFVCYGARNSIVMFVMLVKEIPDAEIAENLKKRSFVQKDVILQERLVKKESEVDVVAGVEMITLKDPYTRAKLTIPTRSKACKHKQCFEAATFFSLNRNVPTWECPVCYNVINPSDLIVDGYMDEIVQETNDDVDSIVINPDGSWELPGQNVVSVVSNDKTPARNIVNIDDEVSRIQASTPKSAKTPKQIEIINISDSDDDVPLPVEKRRLFIPAVDDMDDIVQATSVTSTTTTILPQAVNSTVTSDDEYIDDDIPMRDLLGIRGISTPPSDLNSQTTPPNAAQSALAPVNFSALTTPTLGVEQSNRPKLPTVFVAAAQANGTVSTPTSLLSTALATPVSTNAGIAHSPSLSPPIGSSQAVANTPLSHPLTPIRGDKNVPNISNFNPIFKLVKDRVAAAVREAENGTQLSPQDFLETPPPSNQLTLDLSSSVLSNDIIRPSRNTSN
ncbi:SUMO ligase siz1 [Boothiomyces sp. JEL0866]|nr:SUMO ligase siz1 [Boothiomyces sp. JEL0866]